MVRWAMPFFFVHGLRRAAHGPTVRRRHDSPRAVFPRRLQPEVLETRQKEGVA